MQHRARRTVGLHQGLDHRENHPAHLGDGWQFVDPIPRTGGAGGLRHCSTWLDDRVVLGSSIGVYQTDLGNNDRRLRTALCACGLHRQLVRSDAVQRS